MFSLDPINRHQYRLLIFTATGISIILIAFFPTLLDLMLLSVDCRDWGNLCPLIVNNVPSYFSAIAKAGFIGVIALATLRRTSRTRISGFWAAFLPIMAFLSMNYLTEFNRFQFASLRIELTTNPAPWFVLAAVCLALLLSFAPDRSSYFKLGYWTADPPLGYVLSFTAYWLMVIAVPRAISLITESIGNYQLSLAAYKLQYLQLELMPYGLLSPVVPAVAFSTSAILLIILGRLTHHSTDYDHQTPENRLQNAIHTTRAAQSLNGFKM